jgi:hypothetical protein
MDLPLLHDEVKQHLTDRIWDVITGRLDKYELKTESFRMLMELLTKNDWEHEETGDGIISTNGWDVDFYMKLKHIDHPTICVSGCVYTGSVSICLYIEDGD